MVCPIPFPATIRKILIVGAGGSGKSTLASAVSARIALPLIHLDALYWQPNWKEPSPEAWSKTLSLLLQRDAWVMDGNFGGTLDQRIAACDCIILLDLPPLLCLWRVIKRRLRFHRKVRPDMAPGCNEHLNPGFVLWILSYRARKRPAILRKLEIAASSGKHTLVLNSQAAIDALIAGLPSASGRAIVTLPALDTD